MEMFYTALKPILFQGNSRKYQNSDFELSNSLESIIDRLDGKDPACFVVYGEPGSGRTTLLSKVCDTLLERNLIRQSDICGLRVRAGCSVQSLWNFLSGISKDRQDKDTASLLLQSSAKLSKKHKAAQDFISSNFKLVCVDDVYSDGGLVWSHLSQLLPKIKAHVIVVSARKEAPLIQSTVTEQAVLSVELKGIGMDSFKLSLSNKLSDWILSDNELWRICTMLNGNPTSLKILTNAVNEFKLPPESFDCALLSYSEPLCEEEASSVLMVLQFVFQHLTVWEKQVLGQLCQLREPLPLRTVSEEIGKLARLGLVDKETISDDTKTIKGSYSVSVACCIQLSSLQLINTSDNDSLSPEAQLHFSVFDLWYGLLSEKLHQLIKDAQGNAWPFVPEKW